MSDRNWFEFFQLPCSLDLSLQDLEKQYFQMQKKAHPDQYQGSLQKGAQELSQILNKGYQILKDPLKRIEHVLQLRGWWPLEQDPELLQQVFLWHQQGLSLKEKEQLIDKAQELVRQGLQHGLKDQAAKGYFRLLYLQKVPV
jgi:molecular chaperone HscB